MEDFARSPGAWARLQASLPAMRRRMKTGLRLQAKHAAATRKFAMARAKKKFVQIARMSPSRRALRHDHH
jgi:hypothetical protein